MQPDYQARMDGEYFNEFMHARDPDYQSSKKSESEEYRNSDGQAWTASEGGRSSQVSDGENFDFNRSLSK